MMVTEAHNCRSGAGGGPAGGGNVRVDGARGRRPGWAPITLLLVAGLWLWIATAWAAGPDPAPEPRPLPELAPPRFVIRYDPLRGLRVLAAGQSQRPGPVDINFVARRAYDSTSNWLRIEATPGQSGGHTPSDANQVFTSIFDAGNNAIHVTCISGCGSTFLASGDLSGSVSSQTVVGLEGKPLATQTPLVNQVLAWTGAAWTPTTPANGAGAGGCASNQFVTGVNLGSGPNCTQPSFGNLTGMAAATQLPAAGSTTPGTIQLTQDLGNTAAAPKVTGLQGEPVSSTAPASSNQFLGWNGSAWAPAQPSFPSLSGTATDAQLANPYSGTGACPANQFASSLARNAAPACAPAVTGSTAPPSQFAIGLSAAGALIYAQPGFANLSGVAAAAQLPGANSTAQGAITLTRDLGGTSALPQVTGLQGNPVASGTPSNSQVLTWNGSAWAPVTSVAGAGTGNCTSNQFVTAINLGSNPSCSQPTFSSLSGTATAAQLPPASGGAQGSIQLTGDLGGTAASPKVAALQGTAVGSQTPTSGQVLAYSGTQWTPATPATGAQIAQDLGGTTSAPKVVGLQGNSVASTVPAANQFLAWNTGTSAWTPTQPAFTNLAGTATDAQLATAYSGIGACSSNQFATALTRAATPTCAQPAFSNLNGTATAAQLPPASGTAQGAIQLTGDLGGTAAAPTVAALQGTAVGSQTPTSGQVLTYGGTQWTPTTPTTGAQIAQDLGGTTAAPKVIGLQGYPIASTAPTSGQCLNYSGTQWSPGSCTTGSGSPGGSNTQVQFNSSGALGGATGFTYNTSSSMVGADNLSVTPAGTAVAATFKGDAHASDIADFLTNGGTKGVWIDGNGNLNFTGNSAIYGATGQSTQSNLTLYGGTGNSNLAPPYFKLCDQSGANCSYLESGTSSATKGLMGITSSAPSGDVSAANQIVTGYVVKNSCTIWNGGLDCDVGPGYQYTSPAALLATLPANSMVGTLRDRNCYNDTPGSPSLTTDLGSYNVIFNLIWTCGGTLRESVTQHLHKSGTHLRGPGPMLMSLALDSTFPAAIANPTTAPTVAAVLTGTTGCNGASVPYIGLGPYYLAAYTYLNTATGETTVSPASALITTSSTYQCIQWSAITSPGAPATGLVRYMATANSSGTQTGDWFAQDVNGSMAQQQNFGVVTYQNHLLTPGHVDSNATGQTTNPPPDQNTTQAAVIGGFATEGGGALLLDIGAANFTVDCQGATYGIGLVDESVQEYKFADNMWFQNCGNSGGNLALLGYDGKTGSNSVDTENVFGRAGQCKTSTPCWPPGSSYPNSGSITSPVAPGYCIGIFAVNDPGDLYGKNDCGSLDNVASTPTTFAGLLLVSPNATFANGFSPRVNVEAFHCEDAGYGGGVLDSCIYNEGYALHLVGANFPSGDGNFRYLVHNTNTTSVEGSSYENLMVGNSTSAVKDDFYVHTSTAGKSVSAYFVGASACLSPDVAGCTPVTGVTATAPLTSSGGATPNVSATLQGSDAKLLTAGTVSGTGSTLCTDASGGATTVGCAGGSGTLTLDQVGNLAATAANSFASGDTWELSGTVTANSTYAVTITNLDTTNSTSGALAVTTTGTSNAALPLLINANAATSSLAQFQSNGTTEVAVTTGGIKVGSNLGIANLLANQNLTIQNGADSAATSNGGALTVRGANNAFTSGTNSASSVVLSGGSCTGSSSGTCTSGGFTLETGTNNAATATLGLPLIEATFVASGTLASGNVVCITSTAMTVAACTAGQFTRVGIAQGTSGQIPVAISGSIVNASFDGNNAAVTVGDQACLPPASTGVTGKLHDGGTSTACPSGQSFGVVTGNVSNGTSSSATANVLIH